MFTSPLFSYDEWRKTLAMISIKPPLVNIPKQLLQKKCVCIVYSCHVSDGSPLVNIHFVRASQRKKWPSHMNKTDSFWWSIYIYIYNVKAYHLETVVSANINAKLNDATITPPTLKFPIISILFWFRWRNMAALCGESTLIGNVCMCEL